MNKVDLIVAISSLGGSTTTYQLTKHILGRERQHPDDDEDWEFLAEQDNVRTKLRNLYRLGCLKRCTRRGVAPQHIYSLLGAEGT